MCRVLSAFYIARVRHLQARALDAALSRWLHWSDSCHGVAESRYGFATLGEPFYKAAIDAICRDAML